MKGIIAFNSTSVTCLDLAATEKTTCGIVVAGFHVFFSFISLAELLYVLRRAYLSQATGILFSSDDEFIGSYFLGITMTAGLRRLTDNGGEVEEREPKAEEYKNEILRRPLPVDIDYDQYGGTKYLDDMLPVDLVIHTRRTQYDFGKETKRHEMHDVFMHRYPSSQCIKIEKIEDIFHFNEKTDTNGEPPCKILVNGRAGIGKTMLTRKIQYDWANDISEVCLGKIVFYFQLRWFNLDVLHNMTLKELLRHGAEHFLKNSNFETIFLEILEDPTKAILIFDGLDESNVNLNDLKTAHTVQIDDSLPMSVTDVFLKLLMGNLLQGATVLITSRPNASEVYLQLRFDRQVEILGFTRDKIEQYVEQYCENNNVPDLKEKIWSHIKKSDDLLSMCYIPVNCLIACVSLHQSLTTHHKDDKALPETLTELYQDALHYFTEIHHHRKMDKRIFDRMLRDVSSLAFDGVTDKQLIFNSEKVDKEIENFGLWHRLPNAIFPLHVQFCFLHLSLQEFLAALHITKTFTFFEISDFIIRTCHDGRWHLVIQFVAGILGNSGYNRVLYPVRLFGEHLPPDFFLDEMSKQNKTVGVLMMKCLQEIKDEKSVKRLASNMLLLDDNMIQITCSDLYPGDWKAIDAFLKHMMNSVKGGKLLF